MYFDFTGENGDVFLESFRQEEPLNKSLNQTEDLTEYDSLASSIFYMYLTSVSTILMGFIV